MKTMKQLVDPRCEIHSQQMISEYELVRGDKKYAADVMSHLVSNMAHAMSRELERRMEVTLTACPKDCSIEVRGKAYVFSEGELVDLVNRIRTEVQQDLAEVRSTRRYSF